MTRLPIVNYSTMDKLLVSIGFQAVRKKGKSCFLSAR